MTTSKGSIYQKKKKHSSLIRLGVTADPTHHPIPAISKCNFKMRGQDFLKDVAHVERGRCYEASPPSTGTARDSSGPGDLCPLTCSPSSPPPLFSSFLFPSSPARPSMQALCLSAFLGCRHTHVSCTESDLCDC